MSSYVIQMTFLLSDLLVQGHLDHVPSPRRSRGSSYTMGRHSLVDLCTHEFDIWMCIHCAIRHDAQYVQSFAMGRGKPFLPMY